MTRGVRDVIDAARLDHLLPAIDREVREARHRGDHRAALEMLNESQARFDALASNLPGMLFHLRRDEAGDYRFLFVSEGCQKLFGFKQQHLLAAADKLFEAFDNERRRSLEAALRDSALHGTLAETLERACRVHPIAALQTEYSLWSRDPEDAVLATCRRLG